MKRSVRQLLRLFVMLFFIGCCLSSTGSQLEDNYIENLEFSGIWVIKPVESFSAKSEALYLKELNLMENKKVLPNLELKINAYSPNYRHHIGLHHNLDYIIYSAGTSEFQLYNVSHKNTDTLKANYIFVNQGGMVRLVLFLLNERWIDEFDDVLLFDVMNESEIKQGSLHLANDKLEGEYLLERKSEKNKVESFDRKNNKQLLNYMGLRGAVKSLVYNTYRAKKISSGTYVSQNFVNTESIHFNKDGEILSSESGVFGNVKNEDSNMDFFQAKYKQTGNYHSSKSILVYETMPCHDSMLIKRTNTSEVVEIYDNGIKVQVIESELYNHVKLSAKILIDGSEDKIAFTYDQDGNVYSEIGNENNKVFDYQFYYIYLSFDNNNNWTKRVRFNDELMLNERHIETRIIDYYD